MAVENLGLFWPFIGPRRRVLGRLGVSGECGPRGGCRLREMNRIEHPIANRLGAHRSTLRHVSRGQFLNREKTLNQLIARADLEHAVRTGPTLANMACCL